MHWFIERPRRKCAYTNQNYVVPIPVFAFEVADIEARLVRRRKRIDLVPDRSRRWRCGYFLGDFRERRQVRFLLQRWADADLVLDERICVGPLI